MPQPAVIGVVITDVMPPQALKNVPGAEVSSRMPPCGIISLHSSLGLTANLHAPTWTYNHNVCHYVDLYFVCALGLTANLHATT